MFLYTSLNAISVNKRSSSITHSDDSAIKNISPFSMIIELIVSTSRDGLDMPI